MKTQKQSLKNYDVTLWRYPSEEREPNKVNESVFYLKEMAKDEQQAIRQASQRFVHAVWESHASEA